MAGMARPSKAGRGTAGQVTAGMAWKFPVGRVGQRTAVSGSVRRGRHGRVRSGMDGLLRSIVLRFGRLGTARSVRLTMARHSSASWAGVRLGRRGSFSQVIARLHAAGQCSAGRAGARHGSAGQDRFRSVRQAGCGSPWYGTASLGVVGSILGVPRQARHGITRPDYAVLGQAGQCVAGGDWRCSARLGGVGMASFGRAGGVMQGRFAARSGAPRLGTAWQAGSVTARAGLAWSGTRRLGSSWQAGQGSSGLGPVVLGWVRRIVGKVGYGSGSARRGRLGMERQVWLRYRSLGCGRVRQGLTRQAGCGSSGCTLVRSRWFGRSRPGWAGQAWNVSAGSGSCGVVSLATARLVKAGLLRFGMAGPLWYFLPGLGTPGFGAARYGPAWQAGLDRTGWGLVVGVRRRMTRQARLVLDGHGYARRVGVTLGRLGRVRPGRARLGCICHG